MIETILLWLIFSYFSLNILANIFFAGKGRYTSTSTTKGCICAAIVYAFFAIAIYYYLLR